MININLKYLKYINKINKNAGNHYYLHFCGRRILMGKLTPLSKESGFEQEHLFKIPENRETLTAVTSD